MGIKIDEKSRRSWKETVGGLCEMTESQAVDAGVALTPGHALLDRLGTRSANEVSADVCCCQTLVETVF